jgi:RNA polymerase sigma factor (sigma-70 family)
MARMTSIEVLLPELRAYAHSLSSDANVVEDLVQDAVERCLRSEQSPVTLADLRPFMFRVIRNLYYDELRRLRVRREYLTRVKRLSGETAANPDLARDALIRIAFERLPEDRREVLFLVDVMGFSYEEAASVIGVAKGTIMSRLSRARKALREEVDGAPRGTRGLRIGISGK